MKRAIIDTGPLVAAINGNDRYHAWTVEQMQLLSGPLVTCEAVVSEACFLLDGIAHGSTPLWAMMRNGGLQIDFVLSAEIDRVSRLIAKYADLPMSLADACVVRMSELFDDYCVLTIDGDFQVYRRFRNRSIPVLMPPGLR